MKKALFFYLASFMILSMTSAVKVSFAQDKDETQKLLHDLHAVTKINDQIEKVGVIKEDCTSCVDHSPNIKAELDKAKVDLGKPLFVADDAPVVVYLKRTSNSPAKIDLSFKNGYRYCEKPFMGSMGGGLAMGCLLYMTNFIDEEISLNLKNLPKLKVGEEETIELKLTKPDTNNPKYSVEVKSLSRESVKSEIDSKFFGTGYNVSLKTSEQ